jgi:hypothetical protein
MIVMKILPQQVYGLWDRIAELLGKAIPYAGGDYSLDQVKLYLTSGHWSLLGIFKDKELTGAIAITYMNMPNDRIAYITLIGGKNVINPDTYQQFKTILKDHNATKIQGGARPSVARLWRRLGFRERYILVENTL